MGAAKALPRVPSKAEAADKGNEAKVGIPIKDPAAVGGNNSKAGRKMMPGATPTGGVNERFPRERKPCQQTLPLSLSISIDGR